MADRIPITHTMPPELAPRLQAFGRYVSQAFVTQFYATITEQPHTQMFLNRLTAAEFARLKEHQVAHFLRLVDPTLDLEVLHTAAVQAGRIHRQIGLDASTLAQAYRLQAALVNRWALQYFPIRHERDAVRLFFHDRLLEDLAWQMVGMDDATQQEFAVLDQIEEVLSHATPMADMLEGVFRLLQTIPGLQAAGLTRPDAEGVLHVERYAGEAIAAYWQAVRQGTAPPWRIDQAGIDFDGQAWESAKPVTVDSYADNTQPSAIGAWAEVYAIRSSVTIPITDAQGHSVALLHLYHTRPGYFSATPTREVLIARLQKVLSTTVFQTLTTQPLITVDQRRAWRSLLERQGLIMYYQPLIDLHTKKPQKVEALARLQTPEGHVITPSEFLPTLGRRELLILFTKGLQQALRARQQWRIHSPMSVTISINFPVEGVGDPAYLRVLQQALQDTHTHPGDLTVELLETEDLRKAGLDTWIADLSGIGVRLAQDDVGSGYSSLLRMGRIAFQEVKLDQGLVRESVQDPRKALKFIHHLTQLGHALGFLVTVEGVENRGLVEAAAIFGANYAQGYALARPMPSMAFLDWVQRFQLRLDITQPRTALGALAASMRWHTQIQSLTGSPDMLRQFAGLACPVSGFIERAGLQDTELPYVLDTWRVAARQGAESPTYQHLHRRVEHLLLAYVAQEHDDSV